MVASEVTGVSPLRTMTVIYLLSSLHIQEGASFRGNSIFPVLGLGDNGDSSFTVSWVTR